MVICVCFGVARTDLKRRVDAGLTFAQVKQRGMCTNCGKCARQAKEAYKQLKEQKDG